MSKHPCLEDGSEHEDSDSDVIHVAARHSIQACSSISLSRQGFSNADHAALDMCTDGFFAKAAPTMEPTTHRL